MGELFVRIVGTIFWVKGRGYREGRLAWIGWDKDEGTRTDLGKSLKGFDFGVKLCFLRRHDR